jgi:hypothetical protein
MAITVSGRKNAEDPAVRNGGVLRRQRSSSQVQADNSSGRQAAELLLPLDEDVLDELELELELEDEDEVDVAGFESDDFALVDEADDEGELLDDDPRLSLR